MSLMSVVASIALGFMTYFQVGGHGRPPLRHACEGVSQAPPVPENLHQVTGAVDKDDGNVRVGRLFTAGRKLAEPLGRLCSAAPQRPAVQPPAIQRQRPSQRHWHLLARGVSGRGGDQTWQCGGAVRDRACCARARGWWQHRHADPGLIVTGHARDASHGGLAAVLGVLRKQAGCQRHHDKLTQLRHGAQQRLQHGQICPGATRAAAQSHDKLSMHGKRTFLGGGEGLRMIEGQVQIKPPCIEEERESVRALLRSKRGQGATLSLRILVACGKQDRSRMCVCKKRFVGSSLSLF
jgi:hypothetical protein